MRTKGSPRRGAAGARLAPYLMPLPLGSAPIGAGRMRVDYHVHSDASYDSRIDASALFERALESRVGVVCVTDHDSIEGALRLAPRAPPGVQVIVGCEFTCADGSHAIGLGLQRMIAERRLPWLLDEIRDQGGLVLLPHPFRRGTGIFRRELRRSPEFVRSALSRADLVECFNGRDTYENNERSYRLAVDHGLAAVAGSDAHRPAEIGSTYVEYEGDSYAHGRSRRSIVCPPQEPRAENALKRRALEFYHLHKERLPAFTQLAYRELKARFASERPRAVGPPRARFEFPGLDEGPRHGRERIP